MLGVIKHFLTHTKEGIMKYWGLVLFGLCICLLLGSIPKNIPTIGSVLAKSNISPSGHVFEDSTFDTAHMRFELSLPTGSVIEQFDDDEIIDSDFEEVTDTRQLLIENIDKKSELDLLKSL
jgi:hypothetical protein